ncbi:MAG: hypothetical protein [Caudoviricetes sp.]|nr:MAG: hypothetical protein [Caudoviricetes sp.]
MRSESEINLDISKALGFDDFDKYHDLLNERETTKLIEAIHKAGDDYDSIKQN